jgi:MSHA biogenesis protein MshL
VKKTIIIIAVIFMAGCVTASKNLKELPVTQMAPEKVDKEVQPMQEMFVSQMVDEEKEREKFFSLSVSNMEPEYNMVVDPDVTGVVTVSLQDLPLEKVLPILLEPLGLEYTIEENILRVSKPRMVTRTFEFVYSTTVRHSRSTLVAMTGGGSETAGGEGSGSSSSSFGSIEIEETINVWAEFETGIRDLLSETGKLGISKRVGRISVTDYRSNMEKIASFIEYFKIESKKQILIRAKILEITLVEGSQFGIDINAVLKGIDMFGSETNPGTIVQNFAAGKLSGSAFKNFADPIAGETHRGNLDLFIEALKTHGEVTVLSSPEVSTLNGQKAIIRSVREDVVFQSSQSGSGGVSAISTTTAEPFTYGVFLDVTPHVNSEGMITMDIHPSVSSFVELATSGRSSTAKSTSNTDGGESSSEITSGASAASKPIIDTRETETVATVMDGETVIIAGLMQDFVRDNISKFPILGDIPYLGKLFRREISEEVKTELVILITPTIVGPRAKNFGNHRADYKMLRDIFRK